MGGSKDQWEAGVWHMDKEQWDLLWTGEQAFWKAVPHLLSAGYHTAEELTEPRRHGAGRPYKIPRLMAAQEGECTQTMRIILSRGIGGIDERTRKWVGQGGKATLATAPDADILRVYEGVYYQRKGNILRNVRV